MYQRFSSTVGVRYTVSAYLLTRITSAGEPVEARLGVDPTGATTPGANTVWSTAVTGDSAWTLKSTTVTAASSLVTVFLDGRHPSSSTSQVNVFFDDASVCVAPAPPTNTAANPATVYPGGTSTLSASVESGCTVDWYAGSCGGTYVGSGTSLAVTPAGTTTYYPSARNLSTGCFNTNCGTPVTVTVVPRVVTITPSNMGTYGWQIATSNGGTASFTVGGPVASEYYSPGGSVFPSGRGAIYATCREIDSSTPSTVWIGLDKLYFGDDQYGNPQFKSLELIKLNQIQKIVYTTYVPTIPTILNKVGELHYPRQPIHVAIATTKDGAEPYPNRRWYVNMPWPLFVWDREVDRYGHWDYCSAAPWNDTTAGWYCANLWHVAPSYGKWDRWEYLIAERGSERLVPTSTFWDPNTTKHTRGWKSCGYSVNTNPPGAEPSTGTGTAINFYIGARAVGADLRAWYNEPWTEWWRETYGFRGYLDTVTIGVDFGPENGGYIETTYDFEPEPTTPDIRTVAMSQRMAILPTTTGVWQLNAPMIWGSLINKGGSGADRGAVRIKCFGKVLSYGTSSAFGYYFDLDDGSVPINAAHYDPPYPWNPEDPNKQAPPQGNNLWFRPLPVRVHVPYTAGQMPQIGEYWSAIGYPTVLSWDHPIPPGPGTEVCGQLYLYSTIENCERLRP